MVIYLSLKTDAIYRKNYHFPLLDILAVTPTDTRPVKYKGLDNFLWSTNLSQKSFC